MINIPTNRAVPSARQTVSSLPPKFQSSDEKLIKFMDSAIQEVQLLTAGSSLAGAKPLTQDAPAVKNMCKVIDQLFCSGLQENSRCYWCVVKEFLSRDQVQTIEKFWDPKSERAWSLAWLYQSLNEGTLEWQLICLKENYLKLKQFYSPDAALLDNSLLEKAISFFSRLENVSFDIKPPKPAVESSVTKTGLESSSSSNQLRKSSESKVGPKFSVSDDGKKIPIAIASKDARLMETNVADVNLSPPNRKILKASDSTDGTVVEECQDALDFSFLTVGDLGNSYAVLSNTRKRIFRKKKISAAGMPMIESTNSGTTTAPKQRTTSTVVSINEELVDSGRFDGSEELSGVENMPFSSTPKSRGHPIEDSTFAYCEMACRDHDAVLREILEEKRLSPEGLENPEPFLAEYKAKPGQNGPAAENTEKSVDMIAIEKKIEQTESLAEFRDYWKQKELASSRSEPKLLDKPGGNKVKKQASAPRMDLDFEKQIRERLNHVSSRLSTLSDDYEHAREEGEIMRGVTEKREGFLGNLASKETSPDHYEGEIVLDSGEIIQLAMEVFTKEGEQFYKLFRVYLSHHTGTPLMRWLLLTNYAIYLLIRNSRQSRTEHDLDALSSDVPLKIQKYNTDTVIPLSQLDYISVGLCSQFFTVILKEKQKSVTVCTGSELLTRSVLSSLELSVRRCGISGLQPPSVLTDATPHKIALQKWAANELHREPSACSVLLYTLCYWKNVTDEAQGGSAGMGRTSYLYFREFYPMSWFKKGSEWQHNYFILQTRKLYQFEDSSCKKGLKIFDLRNDITGCREIAGIKEQQHCLELILPDLESTVQLGCQTKHDLQQWLQGIICSLSQADEGVSQDRLPCFLMITSGFLLFGQESETLGFVRTMATLKLTDVARLFVARGDLQHTVVLLVDSGAGVTGSSMWILSLRSRHELDRVVRCLSDQAGLTPEEVSWEAEEDSFLDSDECSKVAELCMDLEDYWRICNQL